MKIDIISISGYTLIDPHSYLCIGKFAKCICKIILTNIFMYLRIYLAFSYTQSVSLSSHNTHMFHTKVIIRRNDFGIEHSLYFIFWTFSLF